MTAPGGTYEAQLDELYGLPLDRFTPARDELVRRLRKQGDRDWADRVKGLRKPSLVAWALNRVRRHDRDRVEQLLAAGARLRDAQQQLLAGGEHGLLRDAVAQERSLVEAVVRLAEAELATAGHPANANLHNKVWQTLQAAARDEQTRELLSIGRLVREGQISDFGLGGIEIGLAQVEAPSRAETVAPQRAPAGRKPAVPAGARAGAPAGARAALERKRTAARGRLQQARREQREFEQELEDLEQLAADAGREAARAAAAAERAGSSADQARAKASAAAQRAGELEAALAALESEA